MGFPLGFVPLLSKLAVSCKSLIRNKIQIVRPAENPLSCRGQYWADAVDVLTLLIADYEKRHFPIADPDPIQFLEFVMEPRGLTRKDLEPY